MSNYGHKNNILQGDRDELRPTSALPIFEGHKMALGRSGLHANCCFNADEKRLTPKIISQICLTKFSWAPHTCTLCLLWKLILQKCYCCHATPSRESFAKILSANVQFWGKCENFSASKITWYTIQCIKKQLNQQA